MSLGSVISASRNAAGMSIDGLADATSIRHGLLREMENDNFVNCGGETYARGHLRNIAIALKVDPETFLLLYIEEQSVAQRNMRDLLTETNVLKPPKERKIVSWKALASISLACIVIAGVAQIVISNSKTVTVELMRPTPTPSVSPTVSASATELASPSASATNAEVAMTGAIVVELSASRGKSWIFANDATGKTLFSGQLQIGSTRTIASDAIISLRIGNAGALDLTVNGKKMDSIGANGEVVNLSFDKNS
jgi:cytoskeletal protein RodZ